MKTFRQLMNDLIPWRRSKMPFDRATPDDLYYCYRLLLKREPDPEGWNYFKKEILKNQYNLDHLVDIFLKSEEFLNHQEETAKPILVELEGFNIYVRKNDFFIGAVIRGEKVYEAHVSDELRKHLHEGDVFVDIGANIGYFTLMGASLVGPQGAVYAFEPLPDNIKSIEMSLEENAFDNVRLYPYAAAESRQSFMLELTGASSNSRMVNIPKDGDAGRGSQIVVESVPLDEMLSDVNRIDVIKMDIEGAEPRAWQGMRKIIQEHFPILIFEFSPNLIKITSHLDPSDFLEDVVSSGYDLFIIDRQEGLQDGLQTPGRLLELTQQEGFHHLDLLAVPKE